MFICLYDDDDDDDDDDDYQWLLFHVCQSQYLIALDYLSTKKLNNNNNNDNIIILNIKDYNSSDDDEKNSKSYTQLLSYNIYYININVSDNFINNQSPILLIIVPGSVEISSNVCHSISSSYIYRDIIFEAIIIIITIIIINNIIPSSLSSSSSVSHQQPHSFTHLFINSTTIL